jgi:hypothetical protein
MAAPTRISRQSSRAVHLLRRHLRCRFFGKRLGCDNLERKYIDGNSLTGVNSQAMCPGFEDEQAAAIGTANE